MKQFYRIAAISIVILRRYIVNSNIETGNVNVVSLNHTNNRNQHWIFSTDDMGSQWDIRAHEFTWLWDLYAGADYLLAARTDGLWYFSTDEWTGIVENNSSGPEQVSLHQNYPNPFNPKTVISWQLNETSQVNLDVYNILGQKVALLLSEKQGAGKHNIEWDASDFPTGLYFYRLRAGDFVQTRRMLLVK